MSSKKITKTKLLLVEGKDEEHFFSKLTSELGLNNIQIWEIGGKTKFARNLKAVCKTPGHDSVMSIGIVRDADKNSTDAFRSICYALEKAGLSVPTEPLIPTNDVPRVTVMVLPVGERKGMLEDVCLKSVSHHPAMDCVESYFQCLEERVEPEELSRNSAKTRVRAFLAAMEWMEEAYFNSIQEYVRIHPPDDPITEKTHAFLSSRYKPNLDLGIAAKEGYWRLDNSVFDPIKHFLKEF